MKIKILIISLLTSIATQSLAYDYDSSDVVDVVDVYKVDNDIVSIAKKTDKKFCYEITKNEFSRLLRDAGDKNITISIENIGKEIYIPKDLNVYKSHPHGLFTYCLYERLRIAHIKEWFEEYKN
jgi:hypothetical protein